jgi:HEAT repeat protein
LYANIQYLADDKRLRIRFEQRQRVSAQMPLFELPIEVAIRSTRTSTPSRHSYLLKTRHGELSLPMKRRPDLVEIDPDMGLFAKWRIKAGVDMLANLARDGAHPDVRLRAVRSLKHELRSSRAVSALLEALHKDKARHVRAAAARVLEQAPRESARAGLLRALTDDPEAKVRRAAARALGKLHDAKSWKRLEASARSDRSYATVRAALRALATIDRLRARPILVKASAWTSYRHGVAIEALSLLGRIADGRDLKRIWAATRHTQPQSLRRGAVAALAAFGVRREASREAIREHLEGLLHDDSMRTRRSVASALRALDDPASRSALLGAAGRESNRRLAQKMKSWAGALGKGISADKRLRRIEETLERLQRDGRGEDKGGDRERDGERTNRQGDDKSGKKDKSRDKRRDGHERPSSSK